MKKISVIILAVIIILILSMIMYFSFIRKPRELTVAMKAVSPDTAILIELKDYYNFSEKLRTKTDFWPELINEKAFLELNNKLISIDSTLRKIKELDVLVKKNPLIISLSIIGKSSIDPTYIIELDELSSSVAVTDFLKKSLKNTAKISSREYEDTQIYTVDFINKNRQDLFYTFYKGLFISSPSVLLVEKSLRQIDNPISITDNYNFNKVYKTSGQNVDLNVYIQYKSFYRLFKKYIHSNYQKAFQNVMYLSDWTELDVNIDKQFINLNGFTQTNDSTNNYLNIFKDQKPSSVDLTEILPANTSVFLSLNLSDLDLFLENQNDYLERKGKAIAYKEWFSSFNRKYKVKLDEILKDIVEEEIGLVYTQINPLDISQSTFFILETNGQSQTMEYLMPILDNWANQKEVDVNSFIEEYVVNEDKTQQIYTFPSPDLAKEWLGSMFAHAKTNYFTFIDDYLIFSKNKSELRKFIDENERHSILENDSYYKQLQDDISSESNIHFYADIAASKELVNTVFSPILCANYLKSFSSLKKFQALVLQVNSTDDMLYSNILLKYNSVIRDKPHTVWESKLDTALAIKPKVVVNHRNSKKEIFVQDLNNKIYLIDRNGKIEWGQHIDGRIISEVYQIDVFRNNKLQYLFNTKEKIYIVDRNGNNIDNFPISLRAPATAGVALFDYDKSRDYRMFIPCKNKKIYVYNIDGKILPGWSFGETEAFVRTPVQHFRIDKKDYILTSDKNRIYILNRRGEEIIELSKTVRKSINNPFYLVYKDKLPYFTSTNPNGTIFMINQEGKVFEKEGIEVSKDHYALITNLNSNSLFDVVYSDEGEMKILYDLNKKISHDFDTKISKAIPFEFSSNNTKIGVADFENREIYLFNGDGTVYKDFPLKGATEFSISLFRNGGLKFNLITGSSDGFLYNYEVP